MHISFLNLRQLHELGKMCKPHSWDKILTLLDDIQVTNKNLKNVLPAQLLNQLLMKDSFRQWENA